MEYSGVSFLMSVKNGSRYVRHACSQLLALTSPLDEVIIIDDGSTDNTYQLILEHGKSLRNLNVIKSKSIGLANALNLGIANSNRNYIARIDVDDSYDPKRIELQTTALNPNASVIFSDYSIYLNGTHYIGSIPNGINHIGNLLSLINSQQTAHPVALISKKAFEEAGGYTQSEFPAEDLGLWYRLSKVGEIIGVPHNLLKYNFRRESVSASNYGLIKDITKELGYSYFSKINGNQFNHDMLQMTLDIYQNTNNAWLRKFMLLRNAISVNEILSKKINTNYLHKNLKKLALSAPANLNVFYWAALRKLVRKL